MLARAGATEAEMPRTCGDDPRHGGVPFDSGLNAPHLRG